ncbi:hypothetical protein [Mesorhizobium captivum]|uniref:hypothetical protein n=1 Tax=Mesorhizobium captivum TaxID=3072319 RepID=UPI002A23FDF8|nr:hypothetical protein [Mesorhizobium sp. VK3C]MDX8447319.1 hypothetical protein [Mesorhizobium sp. VK3C]
MAADVCRLIGEDEDGAAMKWIITGWLLFIVSALFFISAAWRAGDLLALAGGIFFLAACFSFLVPVAARKPQ